MYQTRLLLPQLKTPRGAQDRLCWIQKLQRRGSTTLLETKQERKELMRAMRLVLQARMCGPHHQKSSLRMLNYPYSRASLSDPGTRLRDCNMRKRSLQKKAAATCLLSPSSRIAQQSSRRQQTKPMKCLRTQSGGAAAAAGGRS